MTWFEKLVHSAWAWITLAAIVIAASFPGVIAMPPLDRDESRFSQATAQMLETGDFVVIRYHDDLRNKKPVGIHWLQAASVALTSDAHARAVAAYRLPSLIGAIGSALGAMWLGSLLFGRRAGFLAGAILGSTLLLTTEAHIAKTDAALCFFVIVMMAALAKLRAGGNKWHAVVFWAALAVGVLLKGVISPMIAALALVSLGFIEKRWQWMRPLLFWPGISLFCVIAIPWFIATQIATSGAFLEEAAVVDLGQKIVGAAEGHKGLPGFHLLMLPLLFWPGTLLLVPALWTGYRMFRANWALRNTKPAVGRQPPAMTNSDLGAWLFLICWAVPCWLVFEIAPTKLVHYTLPAYPAFALMAGAVLDRWMAGEPWKPGRWISVALFAVIGVVLAVVTTPAALAALRADAAESFGPELAQRVAFEWLLAWRETHIWLWPAFFILLAVGLTVWAALRKHETGLLAGLIACALTLGYSYRAVVLPNQSWVLATEAAIDALQEVCAFPEGTAVQERSGCQDRAPKIIRAESFAEPSFVFKMGGKVTLPPKTVAVLPEPLDDPRPAWLINVSDAAGREALKQVIASAAAADRCVRFSRRYAYNYSNGEPSALIAAVVEPKGCANPGDPQQDADLRRYQEQAPELEN
jgi:4-amino-4-deoxy-L-arabinose transferase-like glycosyltransferase